MSAWYNQGVYNIGLYSATKVWPLAGSFNIQPTFNSTFSNPKNLAGNTVFIVNVNSAQPNYVKSMSGTFNIALSFSSRLNNFNVLRVSGVINIFPAWNGSMKVGPIWQQGGPCPDPGWTPTGPCNG